MNSTTTSTPPASPFQWLHGPAGERIPVAELDGGKPGHTWLLTAGVHGDEYEGPAAIRQVVATLADSAFPGCVIALPVCNPAAYRAGTRLHPVDAGNLNRAFPGDPAGSATPAWAAWLWDTFAARADRLIDLHAGGAALAFEPVAGVYVDDDIPLAMAFGITPWMMPDTPGVFSREFRKHRGPAVGCELGWGGVCDEAAAKQAGDAIVQLVRSGDQSTPSASSATPLLHTHDVVSPATGEWRAAVAFQDHVEAGQRIGAIHDWAGLQIGEVRAPIAGRIVAIQRLVSIREGGLAACVGEMK